MNFDHSDRPADPVLEAAYAALRQDNRHDVDWDRLHQSIHDRAELLLARRRSQRTTFVRRPLVPLAIAASIALALWAGPTLVEQVYDPASTTELASDLDSDAILRTALGGDLTESEFDLLVTGRAYPEDLLFVAIDSR